MRFFLLIAIAPVLFATACQSECIEIGNSKIDESGWAYRDSLEFIIEAEDTSQLYDLILELTHSNEFSYQNLYVRSTTHFPSGNSVKDPISLNLGDLSGSWNGDCSGSTCVAPILLRAHFRFSELGAHRIVFEQFSRMPEIKGIMEMRLLLCNAESNK